MSGVKFRLYMAAVSLAGFVLAERVLHAHGDGFGHHAHAHWHSHLIHPHHHSHGLGDDQAPLPNDGTDEHPCGGDEHHCCVERCPSDAAHFVLPPRESRRVNEVDTVAVHFDVSAGARFTPELSVPPRAPPNETSRLNLLPRLRTTVLLI